METLTKTKTTSRRTLYVVDEIYLPAAEMADEQKVSLSSVVSMLLRMWVNGEVTPQLTALPKK